MNVTINFPGITLPSPASVSDVLPFSAILLSLITVVKTSKQVSGSPLTIPDTATISFVHSAGSVNYTYADVSSLDFLSRIATDLAGLTVTGVSYTE